MNKQEAKQKLHNMAFAKMNARPDDLKLADVMQVIDQIDEPQKVVVPKFVAEWIEKCKNVNFSLRDAMTDARNHEELNTWFLGSNEDKGVYYNQETFARAWSDGYEIEQEKLYTVEIPNPKSNRIFEWAWQFAKEVDDDTR